MRSAPRLATERGELFSDVVEREHFGSHQSAAVSASNSAPNCEHDQPHHNEHIERVLTHDFCTPNTAGLTMAFPHGIVNG